MPKPRWVSALQTFCFKLKQRNVGSSWSFAENAAMCSMPCTQAALLFQIEIVVSLRGLGSASKRYTTSNTVSTLSGNLWQGSCVPETLVQSKLSTSSWNLSFLHVWCAKLRTLCENPRILLYVAFWAWACSTFSVALLHVFERQVESKDEKGWTPLLHACSSNNIDAIDLLLEKGASLHRLLMKLWGLFRN